MTPDKNKEHKSKRSDLVSFFPLTCINSGSKECIDQSHQKNKSERSEKSIKKTILIQRRSSNSDIWIYNSCTLTGDSWFMEKHPCKQNITNKFAKIAQRFEDF